MESGLLYNPTMKQTNLRTGCKSALQPGTMTGRRSETFEDLFNIYLFSSEDKYKGFSLYQGEDWPIDWNQLQLYRSIKEVLQMLPLAVSFIEIGGKQKITIASICDKKEIL